MSTLTAPRPRNRQRVGARTGARRCSNRLDGYSQDQTGTTREIVCLPGAGGSRLVIDRDADTLTDWRLVAHLAADEPPENARTVCELYLADAKRSCRPLCLQDFQITPFAGLSQHAVGVVSMDTALLDSTCHVYRLREVARGASLRELRWTRSRHPRQEEPFVALTVREVVARLEDYERTSAVTAAALTVLNDSPAVSICRLRAELAQLKASRIVLNRGLREAVEREVARGVSMSQIALRCGRVKHDKHGNQSGQTSWLCRRIGQQAESGEDGPTPWIHTDVLALIARAIDVAPREIELG
jgi:hypothetical protein